MAMKGSPEEDRRSSKNGEAQKGIAIHFPRPEVLRGFILDLNHSKRPCSLSERMSGIREVSLGEFPLDGGLFKAARFTLVVEPDPDTRTQVGRPTAIMRADIELGDMHSRLKDWQYGRIARKLAKSPGEVEESKAYYLWGLPFEAGETNLVLREYSSNTARVLRQSLDKDAFQTNPVVVLQVWDKDVGADSISISLLSNGRYDEDWGTRFRENQARKSDGWEVDDDEIDSWKFAHQVGIGVHNTGRFEYAIAFYEEAFPSIMHSLYKAENVEVPDLRYNIEPPVIFEQEGEITFEDIGGQGAAVEYLRKIAGFESKNGLSIPGMKRAILLAGPSGNGKTTLVEALANGLGVPLLKKTTADLIGAGGNIVQLVESSLLEAKALAVRSNNKAVLCFEQLEALLGQNLTAHDYFLTMMDTRLNDPQIVLVATSNTPNMLHEAVVSRFTQIPILPPNEKGIKEILDIQIRRISRSLGYNVFAQVDTGLIARKLATIGGLSGRDIFQFLSSSYLLTVGGEVAGLDTNILLKFIPDRRYGFKTPYLKP